MTCRLLVFILLGCITSIQAQAPHCTDSDSDGICDVWDFCPNDKLDKCQLIAPCTSRATNTDFEFIAGVTIYNTEYISGDNDGYADFTHTTNELVIGESYDISLTPGFTGDAYNEAWTVWADWNNDGNFDDDSEKIFSMISKEKISFSLDIPPDIIYTGSIWLRISMQYNQPASPCQIYALGEVEDYLIKAVPSCFQDGDQDGICYDLDEDDQNPCIPNDDNCDPCKTVISDDFELGYGNWYDGGTDCTRVKDHATSGIWSVRLRDDRGSSSSLTSHDLPLADFNQLELDFTYYANSMEKEEDFWLQISYDGGYQYQTIQTWSSGIDFQNNRRYYENIVIDGTDFTDEVVLRFTCDASANADQVFLDDISLMACKIDTNNDMQDPNQLYDQEKVLSDIDILIENRNDDIKTPIDQDVKITVYPNPVVNQIIIELGNEIPQDYTINLVNMYGQTVETITSNPQSIRQMIDVSTLENGMYLIYVSSANEIKYSQKIMIMK